PGQAYDLQFFFYSDGGTPSDLNVYWDGVLVYSELNPAFHTWQQHDITVIGTGSDTVTIAGRNDPTWHGIDDVSLTPTTTSSNLIVNGGFETGNFSGWTQSGDLSYTGVDGSLPHSGSFAAYMGPTGSDGFLAQSFATTPGANYTLDYWLESDGGSPNDFT